MVLSADQSAGCSCGKRETAEAAAQSGSAVEQQQQALGFTTTFGSSQTEGALFQVLEHTLGWSALLPSPSAADHHTPLPPSQQQQQQQLQQAMEDEPPALVIVEPPKPTIFATSKWMLCCGCAVLCCAVLCRAVAVLPPFLVCAACLWLVD